MDTRSEKVELKIVRDGFRNYLQIEEIEVKEEQYETQMLLQNDLSFFLKLEIRGINQERKYCYCINSKQSLKRVLELKNIGYEELTKIFMALLSALKQLKEYFLKEDGVYLNLDTIYTEIEQSAVYLCYIPGYYENIGIQVRNLMEQFMDAINHTDQKAVVLVYGLYRITRQENYTLDDLEEFICNIGQEGEEKKDKKHSNQGKKKLILDELFGNDKYESEGRIQNQSQEVSDKRTTYWNREDLQDKENTNEKRRVRNINFEIECEPVLEKKKRGKWWYIALIFDLIVGICITYLVVLLMNRGLNLKGILGLAILTAAFLCMSFLAARKEEDAKEEEEMQKAIQRNQKINQESWYHEEEWYDSSLHEFYEEEFHERELFEEELYGELNEKVIMKKEDSDKNQNKTTVLYEESNPKLSCVGKKNEQIILDHFPFIIGSRKENSDYTITEKGVSRMHADISFDEGMYFITDLNSTNGTFLNGEEIETGKAVRLRDGDEIRIAKRRFVIEGI